MKAKVFICNHPDQLLLYTNLIKIVRKYDPGSKFILLKVNHHYFLKFNFEPYREFFDQIEEFNFIHYRKNFLLTCWEIYKFQKKLKKIIVNSLRNFKKIDLFLITSAWLPVNVLLCVLAKEKNIENIVKFRLTDFSEGIQNKTDKIKSFFCNLYSLLFKCYKIKVIYTLAGKFMDFVYAENTPGNVFKVISPFQEKKYHQNHGEEDVIRFPIDFERSSAMKKDMIIVFGDANTFRLYSEYLPNYKIFTEKLIAFFENIEKKYSGCKLYYKPHPGDKDEIMPGVNLQKYYSFDNTTNAQEILNIYRERIRAVYTFCSSSSIFGSFFAIPSYTFYKYLCNTEGIEKFDNFFEQDNIKSKFLYHLRDLDEIGVIDSLEAGNLTDLEYFKKEYCKLLK